MAHVGDRHDFHVRSKMKWNGHLFHPENYTGEDYLDELTLNWYLKDIVRIKSW